MVYGKKEAVMTRGLAIISMVLLHMFCKLGNDIMCTPLLWVNSEKPFIYWIGFYSEICVILYSICSGYAQYILFQKNKSKPKDNAKRLIKLLQNYWIILIMFSLIGLIIKDSEVPGSIGRFALNFFVIGEEYNGAWWFLHTYVIILLIPSSVIMYPVKKINGYFGIIFLFVFISALIIIQHFVNFLPDRDSKILFNLVYHILNFIKVLPMFWIGAFLCKINVFKKIEAFYNRYLKKKNIPGFVYNIVLILVLIVDFIVTNLLNKAIIAPFNAVLVFFIFNLLRKSEFIEKLFVFLGKHSTNIWLCHMFFYAVLFKNLVWKAKYPFFCFIFMMALCLITSYIEMFISSYSDKFFNFIRLKGKRIKEN